jgi:hypothetical protein
MLNESSVLDLYLNSIKAFPNTTKRQNSIDTIKITNLNWIPFVGVRTLFVKSLCQNESKEYNSILLFKDVKYYEKKEFKTIELIASNGKKYFLNRLSLSENEVLTRCECKDFHWRFKHFNSLDKSLYGRDRKKYEALYRPDTANPKEIPGMCKHLMKLVKILKETTIFVD